MRSDSEYPEARGTGKQRVRVPTRFVLRGRPAERGDQASPKVPVAWTGLSRERQNPLGAQIQGDGAGGGSGTLAGRQEERTAPPPQVGLTPLCTDVLSEGLGSGTRRAKTEDTRARGRRGSGPQTAWRGDASRAGQTALWPEGQTAQGTRESGSLRHHCPPTAVKTRDPDSCSSEAKVGDREGRRGQEDSAEPSTPVCPLPRLPSQAIGGRLLSDLGFFKKWGEWGGQVFSTVFLK